jgi:hypothetical protein
MYDITKEDLKNIIVNNTDVKRWTYNAKFKKMVRKEEKSSKMRLTRKKKNKINVLREKVKKKTYTTIINCRLKSDNPKVPGEIS